MSTTSAAGSAPDFDESRVLVKRKLPLPVNHATNARGVTWMAGGEESRVLVFSDRVLRLLPAH